MAISVPECGIDGLAEVLAIGPCPAIPPGPGRVVTGTFRHESAAVVDVHVAGLAEPIGTTANHPFWSEDRREFVRADALRPGERLRTLEEATALAALAEEEEEAEATSFDEVELTETAAELLGVDRANGAGWAEADETAEDLESLAATPPLRVEKVVPRGRFEAVYNLEVQYAHVYHVSAAGVLVHNSVSCKTLAAAEKNGVQHVYQLKKDGKVVYYGITKDPIARVRQHAKDLGKDFDTMEVLTRKLDHNHARSIEGGLIRKQVDATKVRSTMSVEAKLRAAGLQNKNRGRVRDNWVQKNGKPYAPLGWAKTQNPLATLDRSGNPVVK